ncbi:unnamed protein product [Rotaria sp. Silwood1]|nr:unnamed protein product [Rotaria sp. Silwood1]CAF1659478.1 unnamed protein product [Rotaria sp. Silwood1]
MNTPLVSKSNFEKFYKNIIISKKHRIEILRLSNSFIIDIVLLPIHFGLKFISLEKLILDQITEKNFDSIFDELKFLSYLHSLVLNFKEYIQNLNDIFSKIMSLSKLKYCKTKYRIKTDQNQLSSDCNKYSYSSVEHLIIDGRLHI